MPLLFSFCIISVAVPKVTLAAQVWLTAQNLEQNDLQAWSVPSWLCGLGK